MLSSVSPLCRTRTTRTFRTRLQVVATRPAAFFSTHRAQKPMARKLHPKGGVCEGSGDAHQDGSARAPQAQTLFRRGGQEAMLSG